MNKYFPEVPERIPYEGAGSDNPLSFKYYDAQAKVGSKTMEQHLKFAVAYWHTFKGTGADPFGGGSLTRAWATASNSMDAAFQTLDANFEFISKLGARYWCFHDRDIAPEGATVAESRDNLSVVVEKALSYQKATGVKLLWGTANCFSHARYTHGAATNPDPLVFAHAAAQVRAALEATVALDGTGYVFWGGREGYSTLLNTNMKHEREQMAALLHMAVAYGRSIGFKGTFFIEPKPREPTTHQYDYDAATVLGFLREFDLLDDFALNIEANHATLAGHTFHHELQVASDAGKLGSIDVNRGDPTCGWDTDQFPADLSEAALAMMVVLRQRGLAHGGLNFDAKVRRGSFDPIDLFLAHIGGMDTFARGLVVAHRLLEDKVFSKPMSVRYSGYRRGMGKRILSGAATLTELEEYADKEGEPKRISGRQEGLENILNRYILES